jgi:hypothetical protein
VSADLLPTVLEHLTRISANHATCSRPTAFPHPQGLEAGLWVRHTGGATLIRMSFRLEGGPDRIVIRRVVLTHEPRLPDWVLRPDEWGNVSPWSVVDL